MEELEKELREIIKIYGIDSKEAYQICERIAMELDEKHRKKKTLQGYYNESLEALIQYMKGQENNPNEKCWNQYAIEKDYLSSKTMGYISGIGFNKLCKDIRKKLNRQIKIS